MKKQKVGMIPLLDETQAAQLLGLSMRTLQAHRAKGVGCTYVKLERLIRYRVEDIVAYVSKIGVATKPIKNSRAIGGG